MKVHTAVLGAGFSLVVGGLPLVDDLGERVRAHVTPQARREVVFRTAPAKFARGSFERWLSRVAEPQPDLSDEENAANQFAFQVVTNAIHEVLVDAELSALTRELPSVLERLVTCWHELRATVITFNYDTLVERAAKQVVNRNARHLDPTSSESISTYTLLNNLPPQVEREQMGYGSSETMRIIKGSAARQG